MWTGSFFTYSFETSYTPKGGFAVEMEQAKTPVCAIHSVNIS